MFVNYFKTAFRFLVKNKSFTFINIFGLAVGTMSCLYILLYVQEQYSYDKHQKNAEDIYRITSSLAAKGDRHLMATASPPIAPAMKNDFPEVEQYTRAVGGMTAKQHLLRYKENSFYEKKALFVDSTFFKVFTYNFSSGTATNALAGPYSIVLLKPTADKLFGSEDPVGKTIEIDNAYGKHNFLISGVVDETLGKSHIQANLFISMNSGGFGSYVLQNTSWAGNNFVYAYVRLRPNSDAVALEKKLPTFLNKYGQQQLKEMGMQKQLHLQAIRSIHTNTSLEVEQSKTVSPSFLTVLLLIAFLIQGIACINFMNLSTARASNRAKEVGVRKVIGAGRSDLVRQFMTESFCLSLIAVLIAMPLLVLVMPYLNVITQADIQRSFLFNGTTWLVLVVIVLVTGLVAGSYPALYLSAFQAMKVIKGNFNSHISAAGIRRSLVVFQFVLSIVLIAGIIVIYSQLDYIKHKDLGFDKSQKLIFSFYTDDTKSKMTGFTDELMRLPEISAVSKANNFLSQFVFNDHGVYLAGGDMAHAVNVQNMTTDENFVRANSIRLVSGRDFPLYDSGKVLVNETLVRRLGLTPEKAPGTRLYTRYEPDPVQFVEIAGVMKDFNYNSLHQEVRPFMLVYNPGRSDVSNVIVAANTKDYQGLLKKIETIWHREMPAVPFQYTFLDDEVQKQYETEITFSRIITSFTIVAILISCLGLFGLAAFSAEQRKKEIGVRKVLGATVPGIVRLLSKDFVRLVILSFLIATPIAWWAMSKWLQAFVYRTDIRWWMFAIAGGVAILIALITVSSQAFKQAIANPVKNLRTE